MQAIRYEVSAIDSSQTIAEVKTMEEVIGESEGRLRSIMFLLELFAAVGLTLAAVGIYGVIAYSVAQRTKEMGIRRALGAERRDLVRLVLRQALSLAAIGSAIGIAAAFALTKSLKSLLFGVSPTDPIIFAGIALLLLFVAMLASYIPARSASRVDPASALRVGN